MVLLQLPVLNPSHEPSSLTDYRTPIRQILRELSWTIFFIACIAVEKPYCGGIGWRYPVNGYDFNVLNAANVYD